VVSDLCSDVVEELIRLIEAHNFPFRAAT
jgi:hypothetical protein